MRTKMILILAALFTGLAGACGGGGGDSATPLEAVQNASAETAQAQTASIAMKIMGGQGNMANATFDGAYDFANRLLTFTLDASKLGVPGATGTVEAVMDFGDSVVQYMRFPGLAEETGGKRWIKIDLAQAVSSICPDVDFAALLQAQSGDPTSGLQILEGAKSVTKLGSETVRGVQTTRYRVMVDIRDAAERAPEKARPALRELASWYTEPIQTSEVWIDDEGRARRFEQVNDTSKLKLPACLQGAAQAQNPFQGTTKVSYELFDFGKKVDIKVPASSDVVDLADLTE